MNWYGYRTDPQGILDHYEGDDSDVAEAVKGMNADDLNMLSARLHGDDYLNEAYREAMERIVIDI